MKKSEIKNQAWTGIIYGRPGCGKSSLALTAGPGVYLADFDGGIYRANGDCEVIDGGYKGLVDFCANPPADCKTFVLDTVGAIVDYLIMNDPRLEPIKTGTGNTIKAWGTLLNELKTKILLPLFENKNINKIFLFHEKRQDDGGEQMIIPLSAGSAKEYLFQKADFIIYLQANSSGEIVIKTAPRNDLYTKNMFSWPAEIRFKKEDKDLLARMLGGKK